MTLDRNILNRLGKLELAEAQAKQMLPNAGALLDKHTAKYAAAIDELAMLYGGHDKIPPDVEDRVSPKLYQEFPDEAIAEGKINTLAKKILKSAGRG